MTKAQLDAVPRSRSRLDTLVKAFPQAIIGLNRHGDIVEWNAAATQLLGWTSQEVIGSPLPCIPHDQREEFEAALRNSPSDHDDNALNETQWLRRDGSRVDIGLWISHLRGHDGKTTGTLLVATNISRRKQAEAVLQKAVHDAEERQALLDATIREAPVGFALFDCEHRYVRVNDTLARMNGLPAEQHAGLCPEDIIPDIWPNIEPALDSVLSGSTDKATVQFNGRTSAAPGLIRTWVAVVYPLRDSDEQITGAGFIIEETTLQKRATILVDGQKLTLELMVQNAPLEEVLSVLTSIVEEQASGHCVASIILVGEDNRLRHGAAPNLPAAYNAALEGFVVSAEAGTCGRAIATGEVVITPDIDVDPHWQNYKHLALPHGLRAVWSMPIISSSGEVLGAFSTYFEEPREPTETERQTVEILSRTAAIAIERSRAEAALRESETRFRLMADTAPAIVWMTDSAGACVYLNSMWYQFTGLSPYADPSNLWISAVHPDDCEKWLEQVAHASVNHEPYRHEYRLQRHDGAYRWFLDAGAPRFSETGEFLGYVGSAFDITDHRLTEEQLRAANAAKDDFLGMISHELRTPITVILGQSDLLSRKEDQFDQQTRREMIDDIHRESVRLHQIIENLLILARLEKGQQAELEPVIVDRLLHRVVSSFQKTNPERPYELKAERAPLVTGSPLYIEQIMRNLISNAGKFSPIDQPVTVAVEERDNRVVLSVRDRGLGVSPEEQERIFAPFYHSNETNPRAEGFGIGLAVCRRLADAMGAQLRMESAPGKGSIFSLSLERAEE